MKIDEIKSIVELMSKNDLTEFKIEAEEMHLCIKRGSMNQQIITAMPSAVVAAPQPLVANTVTDATTTESTSIEDKETIDAPLVGTFYSAASPEVDKYVKVGDTVDEESVVCIIEAMKVMNEVKAEKAGVIKEILVENSTPVEFGQALFVIE